MSQQSRQTRTRTLPEPAIGGDRCTSPPSTAVGCRRPLNTPTQNESRRAGGSKARDALVVRTGLEGVSVNLFVAQPLRFLARDRCKAAASETDRHGSAGSRRRRWFRFAP